MPIERSFVIVKPDGIQRGLLGEVISRFEKKGLKIIGLKLIRISEEQAERQYECHIGKPFHRKLVNFMTSGPSAVIALEGLNAIKVVRNIVGATDPVLAAPGSIRGDFSLDMTYNIVHASDSVESCNHELPIFFSEKELVDFQPALKNWINSV